MATVIVTDAGARASLAAVRSLGRAGHRVFVTAGELPALAAVSRYAAGSLRLTLRDGATALQRLESCVAELGADVVLPTTDDSMGPILRAFGRKVGTAIVAGPSLEAYEALSAKHSLLRIAAEEGVPVPATQKALCWTEVLAAADQLGFPCIIKPHRSVVGEGSAARHLFVRAVSSREELEGLEDHFPADAFPILVQEKINGPGEGAFLLMNGGHLLAAFAHRRLREYPPSGGASTLRESILPSRDLVEYGERLLRTVDWDGPAMVEFKRCERTGVAYLMEVNGRFWGSLQLAIDAGVDFPNLLVRAILGEPVEPVHEYPVGIRTRWFWGDVDHLLTHLRHGSPRQRLAAIARFARFRPGDFVEPWDVRDPRPFYFESRKFIASRLRRWIAR